MPVVLESSQIATANAISVTCTKPSGTVSGDVLVAFWGVRASKTQAQCTLPSGWSYAIFEGGQNPSLAVAYKVAGGSEPADYTFTLNASTNQGVIIGRFSGVDTTTPSDVAASSNTGTSTTLTATGITTVTNGAMVLSSFVLNLTGDSYSISTPSGMTLIQESEVSIVNLEAHYVEQATAGATGDKTSTLETSGPSYASILWALRPSSSGATTLTVQDSAHAHAAESKVLSVGAAVVVADSAHTHAVDSTVLSVSASLAVADSAHAHAADNITLETTGLITLVVQDSAHAHTVEAPSTTVSAALTVADSAHAHAVDAPALAVSAALAVADAAHAHAVDNITLAIFISTILILQDASHAHTAENVTVLFVGNTVLAVQDSYHFHWVDGPIDISGIAAGGVAWWLLFGWRKSRHT